MKKEFVHQVVAIAMFLLVFNPYVAVAKSPPKEGGVLPEMTLSVPENQKHREYLGLSGEGRFEVSQIKAQAVIIEIFSMYCPFCQKEAPRVNELYEIIESTRATKGKIKLIGIGAGNSSFEVDVFRKKYNVSFPLFQDSDFSIHKNLGEVRTPYFIGVKIKPGGGHEVFYSKLGGFKKPEAFLKLMLELSGLK